MESPCFFSSGSRELFGMLHEPDRQEPAEQAWILVHAFGEEKLWSHRVLLNMARDLVSSGATVLRFDMSGQGDSSGYTEQFSVGHYLDDIDAAINYLRERCRSVDKVNLLGLRFGATLACKYAEHNSFADTLVLWEPILDGAKYVQELLRINLTTQLAVYGSLREDRERLTQRLRDGEAVNVDGYLISGDFLADCEHLRLEEADLSQISGTSIVIQIAPTQGQKERDQLVGFAERFPYGRYAKVVEPPFWREIKPFVSRAESLVTSTLQLVTGDIDG